MLIVTPSAALTAWISEIADVPSACSSATGPITVFGWIVVTVPPECLQAEGDGPDDGLWLRHSSGIGVVAHREITPYGGWGEGPFREAIRRKNALAEPSLVWLRTDVSMAWAFGPRTSRCAVVAPAYGTSY